ncbi:MAG TPA: hypothetical protein VIL51_12125 [Thermoleophilia bacterium]
MLPPTRTPNKKCSLGLEEGLCERGVASDRLWELIGVLIAIVEFHARYRGGGTDYPFGTPEGIKTMIERQVEAAFPREET